MNDNGVPNAIRTMCVGCCAQKCQDHMRRVKECSDWVEDDVVDDVKYGHKSRGIRFEDKGLVEDIFDGRKEGRWWELSRQHEGAPENRRHPEDVDQDVHGMGMVSAIESKLLTHVEQG